MSTYGADPRRAPAACFGAVRYQSNLALVHTDPALLPRRRKVWSAWNYLAGAGRADDRPVSVSYLSNRLQPLPFETPVVVSLNPFTAPAADKLLARIEYSHPVFDQAAIAAWYFDTQFGITGYVLKDDAIPRMLRLVRGGHRGGDYAPPGPLFADGFESPDD